jgi:hypothetical protein
MTSLGKWLVMINFALSLIVAAWAMDLYATRIDWSNKPGKGGEPDGELVARLARIKQLSEALGPASNAWNANRFVLANLDTRRAQDRTWYETQLAFARNQATKANPAQVVKLVNGQPVPAKPGVDDRPIMEVARDQFGQPLQSVVAYNQADEVLHQQIDVVTKNLTKTIEEDTELTNRIVGDPGTNKGLQQRILGERAKLVEVDAEKVFVRSLLINAVVNSDLVFRRQRSLEGRIKELEKTGVARAAK